MVAHAQVQKPTENDIAGRFLSGPATSLIRVHNLS